MKKQFYSKLLFLFALLLTVSTTAWAETGTIRFGSASGSTKINAASVEGTDTQNNTWTITTVGTTYFNQDPSYSHVGSGNNPASSITFTATLPANVNITAFSAKFAGFSGTKGSITLKVGDTSVGTGALSAANEVTVSSTSAAAGNVLTITITNIAKGVKVYEINYTYTAISGVTVEAPVLSQAAGLVNAGTVVNITNKNEDLFYFYTVDGEEPTVEDFVGTGTTNEFPDEGVTINAPTTLKVVAVDGDGNKSEVVTAVYKIPVLGYTLNFETNDLTLYSDWEITNAVIGTDAIKAHGGTYYATTGGNATASFQTKEVIALPGTFTAYISKQGTNTNASSNWKVQVSSNGTDWNDVGAAQPAGAGVTAGTWIEVTRDLSEYSNVYVRLYYGGTTAIRTVDDISLTMREPAPVVPSITAEADEVNVDAAKHEGSIAITYNNITEVVAQILTVEADGETPATYGWITAEIDDNNNISYIIEENPGEERTAYLKVRVNNVYSNLITITQAKAPEQSTEFTVIYYVAGEEFNTTRQEGEALSLPEPDARGGYQFAGWSTANNATTPDFVENTAAVNSDLMLYAIFVKGVGEPVYTKVTDTTDITDGQYLIVYEGGKLAFNGSLETLDASENTIAVEISDDKKIASSDAVDAVTFTINATTGTIQSASGLFIGNTSNSNFLEASEETAYTNTLSIDEDGNAVVLSSGGAYLRYNSTSGQLRFRYYKSSTYTAQKAIQLYKKTTSATYTLNEPEVSISTAANATWVAPAKVHITNTDVKVYTVTYDDAVGCARKHEVKDKVVPANGVVLLTSDAATTVTFENTALEAKDYAAPENDNDLLGSDGTVQGGTNIFCLAVVDNVLGFYPVDSSIKVPAGKAYLKIGEDETPVENAPSYIWFNDDTTAIDSLTTDTAAGNENDEIYSLTGQRVGKNYRGIVIMNGRKVLKK